LTVARATELETARNDVQTSRELVHDLSAGVVIG